MDGKNEFIGDWRFRLVVIVASFFALAGAATAQQYDFGDAPAPYPTLLADNGARHAVVGPFAPLLGLSVDAEPDGLPSADADGDDLTGVDDEDGVLFLTPVIPGEEYEVRVGSQGAVFFGQMSAWIDFDRNGSWGDEGESVFQNVVLAPGGSIVLTNTAPADASPGLTFARFRVSTTANLSYDGPAPDGEVEDYVLRIEGTEWALDFGDAPVPFPTRRTDDGARHPVSTNGPWMGLSVDVERDAHVSPRADGDDLHGVDDEDGVVQWSDMIAGSNAWFEVNLGHSPTGAYVSGWIDLGADGDWADPGDLVLDDVYIEAGTTFVFSVAVPADAAAGYRFARFRCSAQAGLSFVGEAPDGEVEDYRLAVLGARAVEAVVLTNITYAAPGLLLEWEPEDGVVYVIQNSPGLGAEAAWTDVEPPVTAPGRSALIVSAENPGFYRLTTPLNTL